jgi:hypothetical protein
MKPFALWPALVLVLTGCASLTPQTAPNPDLEWHAVSLPGKASTQRCLHSFFGGLALQAVAVMLTVAFIAFMLFQYVGDPVTNLLGQDATSSSATRCARTWAWTSPSSCSSAPSSAMRCRASSA